MPVDAARFHEALTLFNQGEFFECHEVLEDLWRPLPVGPEKTFLQGLLQVGVGFYHWRNANWTGAKNLLTAGLDKLEQVVVLPMEPCLRVDNLPDVIRQSRMILNSVRQGKRFAVNVRFPQCEFPKA